MGYKLLTRHRPVANQMLGPQCLCGDGKHRQWLRVRLHTVRVFRVSYMVQVRHRPGALCCSGAWDGEEV